MQIRRFDTVDAGAKAPHPHNGKLVFNPDTDSEHNILASFIEGGLVQFATDDISIARTFPEEGITVWTSAKSITEVGGTLDEIIAAFEKRASPGN